MAYLLPFPGEGAIPAGIGGVQERLNGLPENLAQYREAEALEIAPAKAVKFVHSARIEFDGPMQRMTAADGGQPAAVFGETKLM